MLDPGLQLHPSPETPPIEAYALHFQLHSRHCALSVIPSRCFTPPLQPPPTEAYAFHCMQLLSHSCALSVICSDCFFLGCLLSDFSSLGFLLRMSKFFRFFSSYVFPFIILNVLYFLQDISYPEDSLMIGVPPGPRRVQIRFASDAQKSIVFPHRFLDFIFVDFPWIVIPFLVPFFMFFWSKIYQNFWKVEFGWKHSNTSRLQ